MTLPDLHELVYRDTAIPADERLFANHDYEDGPQYTPTDMAQTFFARTSHWLRYLEREGWLTTSEGVEVGRRRAEFGTRRYGLKDIEEMAHTLADHGRIDGQKLLHILRALAAVGAIHRMFDQKPKPAEEPQKAAE